MLISILLLLSGCVNPDVPVVQGDDTEFIFEVPKGSTASGLTDELLSEGLISSGFSWKLYTRQSDMRCLKAGRFKVRRSFTLNELRQTLCGVPLANEVLFTVVEGWRIREIDAALTRKGLIAAGEYTRVVINKLVTPPFEITAPTFEGYLYPETYQVPAEDFDVNRFVSRQLEMFQVRFVNRYGDSLGKRSLEDVVIMASMLEREESNPNNRPMLSDILWKRIDNQWFLGVDATSRYTLPDWNDRRAFLTNLRDKQEIYNTRLRKGLPPTAIGNPTLSSLTAAIQPAQSEFWYYLHDAKGMLHPAKDARGHEDNRRRYNVY